MNASEEQGRVMKGGTTVERKSERELVVTRTISAPPRLVFEAWTKPELFRRWWVPKSLGLALLSCDLDVRVGGKYRLVFAHGDSEAAFFGTYLEVTPHSRLAWTNDEAGEPAQVTSVTFEAVLVPGMGEKTLLVVHDLYPSKEALEEGISSGASDAMPETLAQLDELLVSLAAPAGES